MRNCVCGHTLEKHWLNVDSTVKEKHWCATCSSLNRFGLPITMFHTFELDNLSYIEEEAERRGLI